MAERLLLIRHAAVDAAYRGRLVGATDAPLDPAGLGDVRGLAATVRRWLPGAPMENELRRGVTGGADLFRRSDLQSDPNRIMGGSANVLASQRSDYKADLHAQSKLHAQSDRHCQSDLECYSSPMRRCRETAAAILGDRGVCIDPDLREIDFGRWEGRTFAEAAAADPGIVERWASFEPGFAFPGGESVGHFLERIDRAADRLARQEARTVLAVTHGGVIRAMICHLLGLDARKYVAFDVPYGAMVVIDLFDGQGVLAVLERPGTENDG